MNGLERIGTVLQGGIPDRVPAGPLVCGASRRVYGVTYEEWSQDGEIMAKSQIQAHDLIGYDGILGLVDLSVEAADLGQEMVFPIEDTAHPNYDNPSIKTPDDFYKIEPVDPTKSPRMKESLTYYDIICNEKAATTAIMGFVYAPLGILSMMRGAENLFRDCYKAKEAVIHAEEVINGVLVDYIKAIAKTGCHAVVLDTLFASQTIMRKEMWDEIEGPFTKVLADTIRDCGMMVIVHNCGNGLYFDVQIERMDPIAISCAYPPDDCADWLETKKKWGDKVTIIGYASPAQFAFLGTPEEMKQECKKEIEELAEGGNFILATGCEYPPNGSLMNAIAMMEAAELYGKY
jgi:uroporphyrinogen decarboxylase